VGSFFGDGIILAILVIDGGICFFEWELLVSSPKFVAKGGGLMSFEGMRDGAHVFLLLLADP